MACRLDGAKPLCEPVLEYCYWTLGIKIQWNFNQNPNIFIQEKAFENVVGEMASIFSCPQFVNPSDSSWPLSTHFDSSVQDCSNSIPIALELLQSCTEPSILAWCSIYASWKTTLISLVTHICITNSSIFIHTHAETSILFKATMDYHILHYTYTHY